jgi:hypothetical protein
LALHESGLELLSHILAQGLLHLLPFVNFAGVVSLDEPRIVFMFKVELLFLLFLVLGTILGICIDDFLAVEPSFLVALEIFSCIHRPVVRWMLDSWLPSVAPVVSVPASESIVAIISVMSVIVAGVPVIIWLISFITERLSLLCVLSPSCISIFTSLSFIISALGAPLLAS